jgi:hypothetical protein
MVTDRAGKSTVVWRGAAKTGMARGTGGLELRVSLPSKNSRSQRSRWRESRAEKKVEDESGRGVGMKLRPRERMAV